VNRNKPQLVTIIVQYDIMMDRTGTHDIRDNVEIAFVIDFIPSWHRSNVRCPGRQAHRSGHTAAGWAVVCISVRTTSANGIGLPNSQP
jgi:hypothetical protein